MRTKRMPAVDVGKLMLKPPVALVMKPRAEENDQDELGGPIPKVLNEINGELKKLNIDVRSRMEKFGERVGTLEARATDLEQHLVSSGVFGVLSSGLNARTRFGTAVNCDAVRAALASFESAGRGRVTVNAAILSGSLPAADRRQEIVGPAQRGFRVRDLIPVSPTAAGAIEYVRETGFTNNATIQTEGQDKAESTLTFSVISHPVRTFAHVARASRQVLADVQQLGAFLDTRMRYGVQLIEDSQVLRGSGTGLNLEGLATAATLYAPPSGIDIANAADDIGAAIAQLRALEMEADGVVMHPTDWGALLSLKAEDGHYVVPGGPFSTALPFLHGKPVALTTAMLQGEFLVGQFAVAAELFEREETQIDISTEDRDNFVKNLVTVRAEERIALAIYRPEALISGEYSPITG